MKKKIALLLSAVLMLCIMCSCGGGSKDAAMEDVKSAVTAAVDIDSFNNISEMNERYIMMFAFSEECTPDEYFIFCAKDSDNCDEFGVFKAKDSSSVQELKSAVEQYIAVKPVSNNVAAYFPQEMPKYENAKVWVEGDYVLYAILGDDARQAVGEAFSGVFSK